MSDISRPLNSVATKLASTIQATDTMIVMSTDGDVNQTPLFDAVAQAYNPLLLLDTTQVATTAVTVEETLFTQSVDGRWEIGEMRRIVVGLTTAANNDVKTIRVKLGGVELYNSATASPTDTTPNDARIVVDFLCTRVTSTTMYVTGSAVISDSGDWTSAATGELTGIPANVGVILEVTGQNGTASAGDIQLESVTVIKVGTV